MRMLNWLKSRRKQVIIHTSIVMAFVLFTAFVAEPLFERLERVPGEAQLHRFGLPNETTDIRFHLDEFATDGSATVAIRGWAFILGQDSENSEIFIVLKSPDRTYIFDSMVRERPDVTRHFRELGSNLDYSGFMALIPAREIANGEYAVGIYIRKDDIEALEYTNKTVRKSGGTLETEGGPSFG